MPNHTSPLVALFATCANDVMFPQTPIATVELLERLGCRVEFPEEQTCCGQIFTNTGYYDEAMGSVKSYLKAFEKYEYIVGPSGSCVRGRSGWTGSGWSSRRATRATRSNAPP